MKPIKFFLAMLLVVAFLGAGAAAAGTLQTVKSKGFLQAGVNEGLFGFAKPDEKGVWRGLDVDTARAISVAVFVGWPPLEKVINRCVRVLATREALRAPSSRGRMGASSGICSIASERLPMMAVSKLL